MSVGRWEGLGSGREGGRERGDEGRERVDEGREGARKGGKGVTWNRDV